MSALEAGGTCSPPVAESPAGTGGAACRRDGGRAPMGGGDPKHTEASLVRLSARCSAAASPPKLLPGAAAVEKPPSLARLPARARVDSTVDREAGDWVLPAPFPPPLPALSHASLATPAGATRPDVRQRGVS